LLIGAGLSLGWANSDAWAPCDDLHDCMLGRLDPALCRRNAWRGGVVCPLADRIESQWATSMPTTTADLLAQTQIYRKGFDLLSVRHIRRQAWAIIANPLVRKVTTLVTVVISIRTDPITFLISMSLKLFSDEVLPVLRPYFSQTGSGWNDVLRSPPVLGDWVMGEENDFRSCQTKATVNVTLIATSKAIMVSDVTGSAPILQIPSSRERTARGLTSS
jgi:hypothetical protein